MEDVSKRDLKWFFDQWLGRPVSPSFDGSWHYDAAAKAIRIELAQTQPSDAYRVSVEFGVDSSPGQPARVERFEMNGKSGSFTIASDRAPETVTLDPNTWLLADRVAFVKRGSTALAVTPR
jgi:aminopeptidase N